MGMALEASQTVGAPGNLPNGLSSFHSRYLLGGTDPPNGCYHCPLGFPLKLLLLLSLFLSQISFFNPFLICIAIMIHMDQYLHHYDTQFY